MTTSRRGLSSVAVIVIGALLVALLPAPAMAKLLSPIPVNDLGEPTYDFTDDDALFAYVTSDIKGGRVCVVPSTVTSPSGGSCDSAARWSSPNTVVGVGSVITLLEAPALEVGAWRLLTEDENHSPLALSEVFTVTACDTCSRDFALARVQEWKDRAASMRTGMNYTCVAAQLAEKLGSPGGKAAAKGVVKSARARPDAYAQGSAVFVADIAFFSPSGLGMAFAVATLGDLLGTGEAKAKEILADLSCAAASMYDDIFNDPPDPEFETLVAPRFVAMPATDSTSLSDLLESLDAQTAHAEAALTSYERYLGAVQAGGDTAGEREAAVAQAAAAATQTYAQVAQMRRSAAALRTQADELEALGYTGPAASPDHWSDVQEVYTRVRASGFTADEVAQLEGQGLGPTEIDAIRSHFDTPLEGFDPSLSLPDHLRLLADTTEAQVDGFIAFAKEASAVSSRRTSDLGGNGAPIASDGSGTVVSGRSIQVSLIASSPNFEQAQYEIASGPEHGDLTDCQTGVFTVCTYTPTAGYLGSDSFTWRASDSYGTSNIATYTIDVVANNSPVAVDGEIVVATGGSAVARLEASDVDNDLLTYEVVDAPAHGQLVDCDDPYICTYRADEGYLGPDAFTWRVSDGVDVSALATTTVAVEEPCFPGACIDNGTVLLGVNPEAHLNSALTVDGKPRGLTFLPTGNEATALGCFCEGWGAGDAASGVSGAASVYVNGIENLVVESFESTETTASSRVAIGDGTMRVTHDFAPAVGTDNLYQVDVTIENTSGAPIQDLRYRRVMDWDIEPTAFSEFVTIQTGNASNVLFTSDDGFAYTDPLRPRSQQLFQGEAVDSGPADHGALFDFGFGALPAGDTMGFRFFYGAAESEEAAEAAMSAVGAEAYSLAQPNTPDGPTLGAPNTFIFAFAGVGGDPVFTPTALDDQASTLRGVPVDIDVLANDSDPNGDTLEVTGAGEAKNGTVVCLPSGPCTYSPAAGFVGEDSFEYTVGDGRGGSATATVRVTVTAPPNGDPVAVDDSYETSAGVELVVPVPGVLGNDSDPDGDALVVVSSGDAGDGSVSVAADGSLAYSPAAGFVGEDSFEYTVGDGRGGSATATVRVTVTAPPNGDPVAVDDSYETSAGVELVVPVPGVLGNDSDPDGDGLVVVSSGDAGDGSVSVAADGSLTYSPAAGFVGEDSFEYTVGDGRGGSATATVRVTVTAPPNGDPPVADPGGPYVVALGARVVLDGTSSADPGGSTISYSWDLGDGNTATGPSPAHTYAEAGLFTACLRVDNGAHTSEAACTAVAVYDPDGGFVTGGGWITSPVDESVEFMQVSGRATFGFVSKYKRGASTPSGATEFQFQAAGLSFHSTGYEWLVVTGGSRAQFKGSGSVNGVDGYSFMLWADDAEPDTFRIKIWLEDRSGALVVYDNGSGQPLGGGSVMVHTKK